MCTPAHFAETRIDVLHSLIESHRLATIVHLGKDGITANHIPLLIQPNEGTNDGKRGKLVGHVARANSIWQEAADTDVLAIFQGPQAYVSPSWYASKKEHGKVVPTWNYAVVHVRGKLRAIDNAAWLLAHANQATDTNEAIQKSPWKVSDAPAEFTETLLKAIVGIEIEIHRIEGKWKISQNRSAADRAGVANGVAASGQAEMATLVKDWAAPSRD
jgi:transcriptional regulator